VRRSIGSTARSWRSASRVIGTVEREAALEMAAARPSNHLITLGADKAMMWPTLSPICGSSM